MHINRIETVPTIATRGVLLDMAGLLGDSQMLKEGTAFNQAEIEAAMKRQGIKSIEKGDVVLFYTGWLSLIGKDDKRYNAGEPGLGVGNARYLASLGVAAVGADSWGLALGPGRLSGAVRCKPSSIQSLSSNLCY